MATVTTRPMAEDEYTRWRTGSAAEYARELAASGRVGAADADRVAEEQLVAHLPQGRRTPHVHLLRVLDADGDPVGVLWLGPHPTKDGAGYVYDVAVDEDRRGEGLGRATMLAAEDVARSEGWTEIGLNVFGPNTRARTLYDSLGYGVVSTMMAKPL